MRLSNRLFIPLAATLLYLNVQPASAAVCGLPAETAPLSPITGDPTKPNTANLKYYRDQAGYHATYAPIGSLDFSTNNDFFNPTLGTNQRSCGTCHAPQTAWSITPALVQAQFQATQGTDPLFRANDGSVSPLADVSTVTARCNAYKMLLKYADIRIALKLPANANFTLTAANINDPYKYASLVNGLSLFRRPMPATNLGFLKDVMWDGRETVVDINGNINLDTSLANQANNAVLGHAAGMALTAIQKSNIVGFEKSLFTAQFQDLLAGGLDQNFAKGGPINLADPAIASPNPPPQAPRGFTLYDNWQQLPGNSAINLARLAIARGQRVFRNGNLGMRPTNPPTPRHCATCHQLPNVGSYLAQAGGTTPDSEKFINVRTSDPAFISRINATLLAELPKYTLEFDVLPRKPIPDGALDAVNGAPCVPTSRHCKITTTDPGRALITGDYADINKFRTPPLRGLAGRAPYFHNGVAKTLNDVVKNYINIFGITVTTSPTPSTDPNVLTQQEINDLAAFLNSL